MNDHRLQQFYPARLTAKPASKYHTGNIIGGKSNMENILYKTGKAMLGIYARLFLDFDLLMQTELPKGGKLFTCNHPTSTDPFYLALAINEPVYMLATSDVFENPVSRFLLKQSGHIPVLRNKGKGAQIVERAVEYLKAGKNVAIFPEGSLSPENGIGYDVCDPHSGAARIAMASGAQVIPVGVAPDRSRVMKRQYLFSRGAVEGRLALRGPYTITVGKPMVFQGNHHRRPEVHQVGEQIISEIRKLKQLSQERMHSRRLQWRSLLSLRALFPTMVK